MKKKILFLSFLMFLGIQSHAQTGQTAVKDPVEEKTNAVVTRLKLGEDKKKSVYNIFSQTEKRIADLALGTPDYTKLINYINQERLDMLKTALSPEEYTSYQKFYATSDNNEINSYIKKNNAFLTKKAAEEAKAKRDNEKLMQADKQKLKKEEERQKLAEKKAADKQRLAEKKAADKQKLADKKAAQKEKAAAKKEKEKQKKAEAKQKALEKKQKELDKKLSKK
jgi:membrane protein involved in colicin uptake